MGDERYERLNRSNQVTFEMEINRGHVDACGQCLFDQLEPTVRAIIAVRRMRDCPRRFSRMQAWNPTKSKRREIDRNAAQLGLLPKSLVNCISGAALPSNWRQMGPIGQFKLTRSLGHCRDSNV